MFNLSLNFLGRREEAEEVTQDVFVSVHRNLDRFEGRSALRTWIHRITMNTALDRIRSLRRKKRSILQKVQLDALPAGAVLEMDHPGVLLEDREALTQVFGWMRELPKAQYKALVLQAMEGLSMKEVAEILQVSPKAVESLLGRARATLKARQEEARDLDRNSVKGTRT
ncbi:MAG: RNA polymerase sigma factor [Flavobacteriales bacterium]|nr:RNA polymerase sigma factor [Flavobacteriales bacterium]